MYLELGAGFIHESETFPGLLKSEFWVSCDDDSKISLRSIVLYACLSSHKANIKAGWRAFRIANLAMFVSLNVHSYSVAGFLKKNMNTNMTIF